jgi:hypothetical protein
LIRYELRPPFSLERLRERADGKIEVGFKKPLADGTMGMALTPVAFLRRLASLVPPPGAHDTSYFGVLAAHSKWRRRLVKPRRPDPELCRVHPGLATDEDAVSTLPGQDDGLEAEAGAEPPERNIRWADLLKRVFGVDVLKCPCGGTRKAKACVRDPEKARETLQELGLWKEPVQVAKARGPPQGEFFDRQSGCDGVDPPAADHAA